MQDTNNLASEIWAVADLLRGDFKQSQYGRIILPFTILRRLECVLAPTKVAVIEKYKEIKKQPEQSQKLQLTKVAKLQFYNTSELDLSKLGENQTSLNLNKYIESFSEEAKQIFEKNTNIYFLIFVKIDS